MPAFKYTAVDVAGKTVSGVMDGDASRQIRQNLRDMALMPIEVVPIESQEEHTFLDHFRTKTKITAHDLALFTRQLSVLVASSIQLDEALRSIAKQTEKKKAAALYLSARSKVLEGYSLADALSSAGSFPDLYIATIRAGEKSGHLDAILDQLSDYTENRHALQQKVRAAMIYPIILVTISTLIVMGLMTYVVPQIVESVADSGQTLPEITIVVMSISHFLTSYWPVLLVLIAVVVFFFRRFAKSTVGQYALARFVLKLPIFAKLVRGINAARFASTLSILCSSGVPLVEALGITAAVSSNVVMKDAIEFAASKVVEGGNLGTQIERSQLFPPMMVQMIKSGENSGELDVMLKRAAQMQDREATSLISTLLALLEPLMLVVMGVMVFMIILAVMLPIINMNNVA